MNERQLCVGDSNFETVNRARCQVSDRIVCLRVEIKVQVRLSVPLLFARKALNGRASLMTFVAGT